MPHDESAATYSHPYSEPYWSPAARRRMPAIPLRLEFGSVVWRVALVVFVILEALRWRMLESRFPGVNQGRIVMNLLFKTPRYMVVAFLIGSITAVLLDQFVRHVLSPLVAFWYLPRVDHESTNFHMTAHEKVEHVAPARRQSGRRWLPGTLVRTTQRLWFFPQAWDAEPWNARVAELLPARKEPAPPLGCGFVHGLPDRLVLQAPGHEPATLALAEPEEVLSWLPGYTHEAAPQIAQAAAGRAQGFEPL